MTVVIHSKIKEGIQVGAVELMEEVLQRYHTLDRNIRLFQLRTGLRCPPGCGTCCQSTQVEASILECLPLAWEIFQHRQAEPIAAIIEEKEHTHDLRCVMFAPDQQTEGFGRCRHYTCRPLICRLFGYAARRNKIGMLELRLCKVMREAASDHPMFSTPPELDDANPPVYRDWFFQISSVSPAMGIPLFPINTALKKALEYVYWQCPEGRFPRPRKAA